MARKILLADDSVTAQNMGRKILADAGYEVLTVNNGSAALKRISENKPDLIVLDVYMPGYSGLEVCQRLKDSPETARIPVLLTVGKLEPFKPDEARRVRADAHIVKPFEASELLSALARLEDRIVPQADGSRFSSTIVGLDRFESEEDAARAAAAADPDTGWRSRLPFPSKKKKKEEPEAEPEDFGGNFRDFRKNKGKREESPSASETPPAPQAPELVPDIPRDITPEELDALSALVAKLDGAIPAAEGAGAHAEKVAPTVDVSGTTAPAPRMEDAVSRPASEATAAGHEFEIPPPVKAAESGASPGSETEIPVTQSEVVAEVKTAEPPAEKDAPTLEAPAFVPVNTALLAEQPAPIDREDEPLFASTGQTSAAPATNYCAAAQEVEAAASSEARVAAEPAVVHAEESQAVTANAEEARPEEQKPDDAKTEDSTQQESSSVEAALPVPQASIEMGGQTPSDEELAEALRLLTPATGHDHSTVPASGTLEAAQQPRAEGAVPSGVSAARWMAEAVALTPDEAAMSLEEEMFRSFTAPAGGLEAGSTTSPVSAIAAAVESRPTEPNIAVRSTAPGTELVAELARETSAQKESAETAASEGTPGTIEAGEKNVSSNEAVESEEQTPAATFADAVAHLDAEAFSGGQATTERAEVPQSEATPALADDHRVSDFPTETPEEASKNGKKPALSNWRQIHPPASAAATEDAAEAAGLAAAMVAEEAPKAMAAAAAEGTTAASPDANTIASIVDSVLADLRPKIVEEIAKKLARK